MRAAEQRAIATAALLVIGLLATAAALLGYLYRPLILLRASIGAAGTDPSAIVAALPDRGPREVRELARALHERSAALARQREAQLTFLAAVAHELRNPLTALGLAVSRMQREQEGGTDAATQRGLATIARQMGRLDRMIGDLLESARIEAGHFQLDVGKEDLRALVKDALELHGQQSPRHTVQARMPDEPVLVDCDQLRIGQVVTNLVSNAIKYSPAGGTVRIELERERTTAVLRVRDQGIGIVPEEQVRVFEPYRRTSLAREAASGVGLGLAVVKRIVEAHRGTISLHSEVGRGTTFSVRLPLSSPSAPATAPSAGFSPSSSPAQ